MKKLVYDTTFYSGLVADGYIERGGELAESIGLLQDAFNPIGREQTPGEIQGGLRDADEFSRELFGTLIDGEGAVPVEAPTKWASSCFDLLEQQTEWRKLQRYCCQRQEISAITTAGLINELAPLLSNARQKQMQQENGNSKGEGGGNQEGNGLSKEEKQQIEQQVEQAVSKAAQHAEKADSAYSALAGTGLNKNQTSNIDKEAKQLLIKSLRNNNRFASLMDLIGRLQLKTKAKIAKTEEKQVLLADVEYGNDLRRLSQLEIANLAMPETETLFLKRYSENKLLQRKASGYSNLGRGDMIIMLDESGSMQGPPATISKSFVIAMVQMATKQKRKVMVIGFANTVMYTFVFHNNKCAQINGTVNPYPSPIASSKAIECILRFSPHGGTSFSRVMDYALNQLKLIKNADLVMVTDAADSMSNGVVGRLELLKKHKGLRTLGVVISDYTYNLKERHGWLDTIWLTDTNPENLIENLTDLAVEAIK